MKKTKKQGFEVGEIVKCVVNSGTELSLGVTYTIQSSNEEYSKIKGKRPKYFTSRFIKSKPISKPKPSNRKPRTTISLNEMELKELHSIAGDFLSISLERKIIKNYNKVKSQWKARKR